MTIMSRDIRVIMACDKIQLGPFDYVVTRMFLIRGCGILYSFLPPNLSSTPIPLCLVQMPPYLSNQIIFCSSLPLKSSRKIPSGTLMNIGRYVSYCLHQQAKVRSKVDFRPRNRTRTMRLLPLCAIGCTI